MDHCFDDVRLLDRQPRGRLVSSDEGRHGRLVLSEEGLAFDSQPSWSLRWNEIADIVLHRSGHLTGGGVWYTNDRILIRAHGFEALPIMLTAGGLTSSSKLEQIFQSLISTWRARHSGARVPPLGNIFPHLERALQNLPVSVGFSHRDAIVGVIMGLVILVLTFMAPVLACWKYGGADYAKVSAICLSLFGLVGGGILVVNARKAADSRPKIILSSEAINYHRGRKKVSLLWNTIQDIELKKGCLLVSSRSIAGGKVRLKLRGLERGPAEILYMIRPLFAVTQSSN